MVGMVALVGLVADWVLVVVGRLRCIDCRQVLWECPLVGIRRVGIIVCRRLRLGTRVSTTSQREPPRCQGFHLALRACTQMCLITSEVIKYDFFFPLLPFAFYLLCLYSYFLLFVA